MKRPVQFLVAALGLSIAALVASPAYAASATLPDTAVGRLAKEVIQRVNADTPAEVRQWAPSVLAASIANDDKAAFVTDLVSAARDSGGLDVFDVRTDPRQPGLLEVAVKARRDGQRALFVLAADPGHMGQLAQAALAPMQNSALYAGWPKGPVSHAALRKLVHTTLDRLARESDFSGCVSVAEHGKTVVDECRGLANRSFNVPITNQTRFRIGSLDKMFTGVAIAQLVEAGKLSWNDTLAKLVPGYPDHAVASKITVWELLHHTAGLGDFLVPAYFEHRTRYVDLADYIGLIADQPLVARPGKQWSYSNAGYILLGRIIENVSGESYAEYVRRHIFLPAHMDSSGFSRMDEVVPWLAVGYYHDGLFARPWTANWLKIPYKGGPAGGGYSTDGDLLRFAAALQGGKLVDNATLAEIFANEVPVGPGGIGAGFGDRVSHGRHIRGHQGGIEGVTADLAIVWGTGAAVALTSNEGPSQNWLLAEHIADLLAAESALP